MTANSRAMTLAMMCAAAVTAELVGGKATRDALFFTAFDAAALPAMLTATAVCSLLLVAIQAHAARRIAPGVLVPISFLASGVLFVAEWLVRAKAPSAIAVLIYLHVSAAGPLLASGFWLIASERFNPRTAKKGFGRIAAAGTLGGLAGALISERVAAFFGGPTMLLALAGFQFVAAGLVQVLASSGEPAISGAPMPRADAGTARSEVAAGLSGLRLIAQAPYLRDVVALVLLGTASAALVDYVFKVKAVETYGPGDHLLRFFALYYAGSSFLSFILQTTTSRAVLERFGMALTTSTPSIALLAGSIGSLVAPGFGSLVIARGGEAVFRGSWFRAGYELFYTPLPAAEKRATKSLIDVGVDRLGDAVGAAFVRLAILLVPAAQSKAILFLAMAASIGAIAAASRLNRWYLHSLEHSLVDRAGSVDATATIDRSTAIILRSVRAAIGTADGSLPSDATTHASDPQLQDILALRSNDRGAAIRVLSRTDGIAAPLVPHVIALLGSDALADYAVFALRKVAEEHVGQLTDAMLDPNREVESRRRLARVFSICVSQRAADALVQALDDDRFDVRSQAVRSLSAIVDKNPRVRFDQQRIFDAALKEVEVSRPVWESQRLLEESAAGSTVDAVVRDRAGQSLTHVFALLSLVLPREPLQVAFKSLRSGDANLRGTSLEYLEGVLPQPIRQQLWPFLISPRVRRQSDRPSAARISDLLHSSPSVTIKGIVQA
jgi:hypothetical protein